MWQTDRQTNKQTNRQTFAFLQSLLGTENTRCPRLTEKSLLKWESHSNHYGPFFCTEIMPILTFIHVSVKFLLFSSATKSLFKTGCNDAMGEFLRGKMGALGGIAASIAILQIAIITSAAVLIKKWTSPSHCYPCY